VVIIVFMFAINNYIFFIFITICIYYIYGYIYIYNIAIVHLDTGMYLKIERQVHLVSRSGYPKIVSEKILTNLPSSCGLHIKWVTGRQKMVAMHGLAFCKT